MICVAIALIRLGCWLRKANIPKLAPVSGMLSGMISEHNSERTGCLSKSVCSSPLKKRFLSVMNGSTSTFFRMKIPMAPCIVTYVAKVSVVKTTVATTTMTS
jgi:hypothetical protein